ncbi:MAG: glycosyl transferase, family 2 [Bryobacterales bacterium]|nr:glycosyl transferase, family 2 [Bryobacterales bacterium]
MNDTAVVIVTHNSGAEIGACLDAALGTGAEIVVVDNASRDQTRDQVCRRGIRLIANLENLGFAAAVNQGFRATTAPFVLLLNPDAVLRTGIDPLRRQCERPEVGAAGGQLTGADGLPQAGFMVRRLPTPGALCLEALGVNRLWPRNPVNWRLRCYDLDLRNANPTRVEQPAGAFLMIRRDVWERLGGFDEQFHPLWFEDVDFCHRLKSLSLIVFYVPQAIAKHTGAHSIGSIRLEKRQLYWYGSLLKYAAKHYPPFARRLVCVSVMVGSVVRSLAGIFSRHGWTQLKGYGRVIGLAGRYFVTQG